MERTGSVTGAERPGSIPAFTTESRDERVRRQIRHCLSSTFYRQRFEECGIDPATIRTVDDLNRLPIFVTPDVHRQAQEESLAGEGHPFGTFLCVDPSEIVAVSSTSGTTGDPTFYPFTARDVELTDSLWARALDFIGVRPGDRVMHAFGLSMYLAGVPLVRAVERMGAMAVPVGAEVGSDKLLKMIRLIRPRVLACTPSYAEHLLERVRETLGTDPASLGIEMIVCAGEPGAGLPEVRQHLEEGWGARVFDLLGGTHGIVMASADTDEYNGMYVLADDSSVSTQLVDPVTKAAIDVVDGAVGERVKTSLAWEAAPPLRYSVGDVYRVLSGPVSRGPAGQRIMVLGRVDDLLIIKGVKVYPAAVKDLVNGFAPEVTGALRILLDEPPPRVTPPLRLRIECADGLDDAGREDLARRIGAAMHSRLAIRPDVELVAAGTLERTSHKQQLLEINQNNKGSIET
jgi:phenylacetate-CoA ligase